MQRDESFGAGAGVATWGQILFLARKNLFESRLTTLLLVVAMAAGLGFQIPNSANLAGYEAALLNEGISAGLGDVRISPRKSSVFEDVGPLSERLRRYPGVLAVVPVLSLPAAIKGKGRLTGAVVVGADTSARFRPLRMAEGTPLAPGDDSGLLVGLSLAETLETKVGDTLSLRVFLSTGPNLLDEENVGRYSMKVRGLAGGTMGPQGVVFVDRSFLAAEVGAPNSASMVLLYLQDHQAARSVAAAIEADLPELQARSWIDDSAYVSSSIRAIHAIYAVSQTMMIFAIAVPVLALLYINVLNRRRDIGLLTAIGFAPRDVFLVFLAQAALVGFAGSGLGIGLGYGLVRYFEIHPIFEWKGLVIRPLLDWQNVAQSAAIVWAVALLAGVHPALRAAKTDPAPTFRGLV